MSDAGSEYVAMGHAAGGEFSIDEVRAFIDDTLERFPGRRVAGIKASVAVVRKGLGEHYRGLGVSPQPKWYPGERIEVHFGS